MTTNVGRRVWLSDVPLSPVVLGNVAPFVASLPPGTIVNFVNLHTFVMKRSLPRLASVLRGSINLIDGAPVAWLAGRVTGGRPLSPGPDAMAEIIRECPVGSRHFFYGGRDESALEQLIEAVRISRPDIAIVGAMVPPHAEDIAELILPGLKHSLESAQPDYLWVGLGCPKQELVAGELAPSVDGVVLGVGAAFDFIAGAKPRAPEWFRVHGVEWLHRMLTEPRRLIRRYILSAIELLRLMRSRPLFDV